MKINAARLLGALKNFGFWLSWESRRAHEIAFARESSVDNLFEGLFVSGQGKEGEAVGANSVISVLRGRWRTKILNETRFLSKIGMNLPNYSFERNWTLIEDYGDARVWEAELIALGPSATETLSKERGSELLLRTAEIRRSVIKYLTFVPPDDDYDDVSRQMFTKASHQMQATVARIRNSPGVLAIKDEEGRGLYPLAILTILTYGEEVEGRPDPFRDRLPINDSGFMARIQMLVDMLARPKRISPNE